MGKGKKEKEPNAHVAHDIQARSTAQPHDDAQRRKEHHHESGNASDRQGLEQDSREVAVLRHAMEESEGGDETCERENEKIEREVSSETVLREEKRRDEPARIVAERISTASTVTSTPNHLPAALVPSVLSTLALSNTSSIGSTAKTANNNGALIATAMTCKLLSAVGYTLASGRRDET